MMGAMLHRALVLALAVLTAARTASAQDTSLIDRVLQVEDARDDSAAADDTLRAALQSTDPATRALAARAVGRLERAGRLPLLVPALADADARVRRDAAWAVAQIARTGDEARASQRALLARLGAESEPAVTGELAASLGRLPLAAPDDLARTDAALTALLPGGQDATSAGMASRGTAPAAQGASPAERAGAGRTPGPLATLGAVQGLESRSRLTRTIAPLADATLARLRVAARLRAVSAPGAASADSGADPATRARAVAAPAVVRETGPAPDVAAEVRIRRLALAALVQSAAADASLLDAALGDEDSEVRRLAMVAAAGDAPPSGAAPGATAPLAPARASLLRRGLADADASVRYDALRGWGRHQQATDCAPVLAAAEDPNPHVALLALDQLGAGCPGAVADARAALTTAVAGLVPATGSATWHRGAHALVALARLDPEAARARVTSAAAHPVWHVRMYAARAAARLDDRATLVRLGRDAADNVRHAALEALLAAHAPEAAALGVEALGRGDYQLLQAAARAAASDTDRPRATTALLAALARVTTEGRDTSRDPRVALLEALAQTAASSDAAALRAYADDRDPRVAEAARAALARAEGAAAPAAASADTAIDRRPLPPRTTPPPRAADLAALDGVRLRVTMAGGGVFEIALDARMAPASVLRVVTLARRGHYDGLTFHRVVPNFVIQGGSPGANEFMGDGPFMRDEPRLPHHRGAVGISTRGRDTGDAQLFVDLVDVPRLDHTYTVIGTVARGQDVIDGVLEGDVMQRVEVVPASR